MATPSALLLRARDSETADRRALVEVAEAAGPDGVEWCQLAAAWWQLEERAAAVRALERALEHAGEVRVVRSVARLYRTAIGDPDAAAQALAACDGPLMRRGPSADDWRLLAAGWWDAGDRDAALHYLAHAAAVAATVDELCAVALAYADAGDRAAAGATVARAAGAAAAPLDWATIARTYGALANPDTMHASLEAGFERIESADDAQLMIDAYRICGGSDIDILRCQVRAREVIDARVRDHARAFLEAYKHDPNKARFEAPLELVPIAPAAHLPRSVHSFGWPHGPGRLLDRLRAHIGYERLRRMEALLVDERRRRFPEGWLRDWGERFVERDITMLHDIAATGLVPRPLNRSWLSELVIPNRVAAQLGGGAGGIDHHTRAFICTLLCIDGGSWFRPLVESCIALGTEAVDDLVALLASMNNADAKLGLVLAAAWLDPADPRLPAAVLGFARSTFDLEWCALSRAILAPPIADLPHLARLAAHLADDAEADAAP